MLDAHRARKVRYLLGQGRQEAARQELDQLFHKPWFYSLLAHLPAGSLAYFIEVRRRLRSPVAVEKP